MYTLKPKKKNSDNIVFLARMHTHTCMRSRTPVSYTHLTLPTMAVV